MAAYVVLRCARGHDSDNALKPMDLKWADDVLDEDEETRIQHSAEARAAENQALNCCTGATAVEKGQQKTEGSEKEESVSRLNMSTGSHEESLSGDTRMLVVDDGVRNAFRPCTDGTSCVRQRN